MQKIDILGVQFSNLDEHELTAVLDNCIQKKRKAQLCFVPTNSILAARKNSYVRSTYNLADVVMCDGVPVQWASRYLGTPLKQRLTGFDFMPRFVQHAVEKQYSLFFLGAGEGVAQSLAEQYRLTYPNIRIAGYYTPPYRSRFNDAENKVMIDLVNKSNADVLFVSLTAPKQDIWIREQLPFLDVSLAVGIGAAFDTEAGTVKRSPVFFQRNGLEWFYRFLMEPRRMFKRYFLEAPVFIPLILLQKFGLLSSLAQTND